MPNPVLYMKVKAIMKHLFELQTLEFDENIRPDSEPRIAELRAKIPNADDAKFQKAAADAKAGCPVSRVLNAEITLDAKLV